MRELLPPGEGRVHAECQRFRRLECRRLLQQVRVSGDVDAVPAVPEAERREGSEFDSRQSWEVYSEDSKEGEAKVAFDGKMADYYVDYCAHYYAKHYSAVHCYAGAWIFLLLASFIKNIFVPIAVSAVKLIAVEFGATMHVIFG